MNYMIKMGGGGTARLPNEYQEVEYIQSTGTQYIDTGVKLSSSDTINCKFSVTSVPDNTRGIYGLGNAAVGFFNLLIRNPITARVGGGSNQVTSTNVVLDHIYDTSLTSGVYVEDGITYTFNGGKCDGTINCYVFARNHPPYNIPIPSKIYSFEIVGKFNGIPCYRKADGVIGLYDKISETFLTNAGTGTFLKGDNVVAYKSIPIGVFSGGIEKSKIPNEYQAVEWIKGNIDTGEIIIPGDTEETWEYTCYAEYIQAQIIGTSVNSGYMQMFFTTQSGSQVVYFYFGFNNGRNSISSILNKKIIVRINKKPLANDDTERCYYTFIDAETNETLISRYTYKPAGGTQAWIDARPKLYIKPALKTYGFKKIGGKELVPCYRKNDNVIGMYDIVNNMFIEATGTTEKGNNISTKINITYNALKTYNN